jgi:hypothetical protein
MRATEFIRGLLDLIDSATIQQEPVNDYEDEVVVAVPVEPEEDCTTQYSNSPDEFYTNEKTLFSIGNDLNKPKHPSDLRADSVSLYPNMQYKAGK